MACMAGNARPASWAVGAARSGRKIRYIGSLCSSIVLTLVGWTAFTRIILGASATDRSCTSWAIVRLASA